MPVDLTEDLHTAVRNVLYMYESVFIFPENSFFIIVIVNGKLSTPEWEDQHVCNC